MKIREYISTYQKAKSILTMVEILTESSNLVVMNEFRNAFDHLIRGLSSKENEEKELIESYSHLRRASEDAYQIVLLNMYEDIQLGLKNISEKEMNETFPLVTAEILPQLITMRNEVIHRRFSSLIDENENVDHLDLILKKLSILIEYKKQFNEMNLAKQKLIAKNQFKRNWIVSILVPIAMAIISGLIVYIISIIIK